MPIQVVLLTMELVGFPVDDQKISEVASELTNTLRNLEYSMFRINRRNFNIKSKMEVAKVRDFFLEKFVPPVTLIVMKLKLIRCWDCTNNEPIMGKFQLQNES